MHLLFRMASILCTMLLLAVSSSAADIVSYAVLPFKVNGPAGFSYLEKSIPSMLTSRLYWEGHVQPVSDTAIATVTRVTNAGSAANALTATGADYVVWGDVTIVDQEASVDISLQGKNGKTWHRATKTKVNDLIGTLQNIAAGINTDVFGRGGQSAAAGVTMVNQMNPGFVHNETTQRQVYLNPQFRYQGSDGTRLRSQTLPYAATGMAVADFNGDGKNEVAVLSEKRLYVYRWDEGRLVSLGEYVVPLRLTPILIRSIDMDRDKADELVLSTYDSESTTPYAFILSFKGNKFTEVVSRAPYYVNVVRLLPDFMPMLIGQKGDPSRVFSRTGVYEMAKQGDSLIQLKKVALPTGVNALNFACLPGKPGQETDKIVILTSDEHLRVFGINGGQLSQSDETFSGGAIGIAEQTNMPGMGTNDIVIPSKYFIPLRMIPVDLEQDGTWEIMVNRPISVSAMFFENYRLYPEGEIHNLYWDGVGLSLQWKTRRIKGSVVDFVVSDPNNDNVQDLTVCLNTHPGALGFQNRKTVIVAYPMDLSLTDPKTAPVLD